MKSTQLARTPLILTGLLALAPVGGAQIFGPEQDLSQAIPTPQWVHLADLTGDGIPDLVVSSFGQLHLASGNQSGSYGPSFGLPQTVGGNDSGLGRVGSGDLDQDGDLDLFAESASTGELVWIENQSGGQFGLPRSVGQGITELRYAAAEDVDSDGDLDLLVASQGGLRWFPGNGLGMFGLAQILPGACGNPRYATVGDLNGDGVPDLAAACSGQSVQWWAGQGGGAFGPPQTLGGNGLAVRVEAVDLDLDGDLDLVDHDGGAPTQPFAWYENQGNGAFSQRQGLGPVNPGGGLEVRLGDLDGDGDVDVAYARTFSATTGWIENLGAGQFSSEQELPGGLFEVAGLDLLDLDVDGILDVVVTSSSFATALQEQVVWMQGLGQGQFASDQSLTPTAPVDVLAADWDQDGDPDVISVSPVHDKLVFYESLGQGSFGEPRIISNSASMGETLTTGDLDGDGDLDLVLGRSGGLEIQGYWNLGGGQWSGPVGFAPGSADALGLDLADLDGDGWLDLLVALDASGRFAWYRNQGGGVFGARTDLGIVTNAPTTIRAVDLDGDGSLDVLGASDSVDSAERLIWFRNLGGLAFGPRTTLADIGTKAHDVEVFDPDGDGDMDLVVSTSGVRYLENLGGLQFAPWTLLSGGIPGNLAKADVNGDGSFDLIATYPFNLVYIESLSGGGFAAQQLISSATQHGRGVCFADLDQDGDADLVHASGAANDVWWSRNLIDPMPGVPVCSPSVPNSTGQPAGLVAIGSALADQNTLALHASELPIGQVGFFLAAPSEGFLQNPGGSQGNLCLSGPIGRFVGPGQVQASSPTGTLSLVLDLSTLPTPMGPAQVFAGETRVFQLWYRDMNPGNTSNFSSGLELEFQ